MSALTLVHLFPEELGVFGDVGNVQALVRRAAWRGLELRVIGVGRGEALEAAQPDLVHIGNGAVSGLRAVHSAVLAVAPTLRSWREAGVPFLAVAAGWQLLGRELRLDGETLDGAGVFPTSAEIVGRRKVGNVVGVSVEGQVMGFENHGAVSTRHDGAAPFLTGLSRGIGNGDGTDGVLLGESVGTNLGGPLLPLNPAWADRMLTAALARRGEVLPPPTQEGAAWITLADESAEKARAAVADAQAGRNGWLVSGS